MGDKLNPLKNWRNIRESPRGRPMKLKDSKLTLTLVIATIAILLGSVIRNSANNQKQKKMALKVKNEYQLLPLKEKKAGTE